MTDVVLQQNHILNMHTDTARDSDSSSEDVFIELAQAWNYVRKWYGFKGKPRAETLDRVTFKASGDKTRCQPKSSSCSIQFQNLPVNIQLKILSFLDVYSLSRSAMVCRQWYDLANDDILWESKLKVDVHKWHVIDHLSHPELYQETQTEFSPKEIYLSCCPECRHKRQTSFKLNIPRISFFLGFSVPKVVMFGPGLESETSAIVRKILSGQNSPFVVRGMFPGQFDGIGSGVSLQYDGGQLNLITLYSASRKERENNAANGVRRNRFIVKKDDLDAEGNIEDGDDSLITVTQPIKNLCASVDAFIYVVDSTLGANRVDIGIEELRAVVNDRWVHSKAPLLVLSCVANATNGQFSSINVANILKLRDLNRPWQVRACHVSSLYGLLPGVKWLLQEVMKS